MSEDSGTTSLRVRLLASRLHASLGLLQGPALYTVQADAVSIRGGRVADKESLTSCRACSTAGLLPRPLNRTSQCTTEAPRTLSCASGPEAGAEIEQTIQYEPQRVHRKVSWMNGETRTFSAKR